MKEKNCLLKRIVVIDGHESSVVKSRLSLLQAMVQKGYEVHVICPGEEITRNILKQNKVHFHHLALSRHSISLCNNISYLIKLYKKIKKINPTICLTYTIKPTVYGIIASACAGANKRYAVITGLGYAFLAKGAKGSLIKSLAICMYFIASCFATRIIFQNEDDKKHFCKLHIIKNKKTALVNGSGIDLDYYTPCSFPDKLTFLMITRFLPEKGIFEYAKACHKLKKQYHHIRCCLVGYIDNKFSSITEDTIKIWQSYGIEYLGKQDDVRPTLRNASVYVLPSYREGIPRSTLEAMAMSRPIITTDAPGCRQTVEQGKNGFLVPIKNSEALYEAMLKFVDNPLIIETMGNHSLILAKKKFDVNKINKSMLAIMQLE